ncbi:3-deoxy-D-manno-octulosonic-acid kinase [Pandoraea pulmonicola]|uniref:3-deoxy-D-manno-octulosonic-acid kinase n=1 Tax=Pandoraea pulmonicola TaxID=93221 RepID=A0AAJ5D1N1_PANPU|nr:3-deoxy-D-manno-octulosonic-acid kinase [Pandoraea pulmonicola]
MELRHKERTGTSHDSTAPTMAKSVAFVQAAHHSPDNSVGMTRLPNPRALALLTLLSVLPGGGFAAWASADSNPHSASIAGGTVPTNVSLPVLSQGIDIVLNAPAHGELSAAPISLPTGPASEAVSSSSQARSRRAADAKPQSVVVPLTHVHSRQELARRALLLAELDPDKTYSVRDVFPTGSEVPGDADVEHSMSLLDIYVEHGKVKFPALARHVKDAPNLDKLPDLDKYFDVEFERAMKVQAIDITEAIQRHIDTSGIDSSSTPARVFSVSYERQAWMPLGHHKSPYRYAIDGKYGYILDVVQGSRHRVYAVSISDNELTIDEVRDKSWLTNNQKKFFGRSENWPAVLSSPISYPRTTDATKAIAEKLVDVTKSEQREEAFRSTEMEKYVDEYRMELAMIAADLVPASSGVKKGIKAASKIIGAGPAASRGVSHRAAAAVNSLKKATVIRNAAPKMVGSGVAGRVYQVNANKLIKVYSNPIGIKNGALYRSSLDRAKNSVEAFTRLYGKDAAKVTIKDGLYPTQPLVVLQMKKIPGKSLESILKSGNRELIEEVRQQFRDRTVAKRLIDRLTSKGIVHHDINLGNILYDRRTGQFNLIDFDSATFDHLTDSLSADMLRKLEFDFEEFAQRG